MAFYRGKVVVSGAAGNNGFATLKALMYAPRVTELIGLVRNQDEYDRTTAMLRMSDESHTGHGHIYPVLSIDPEKARDANIWVNWKGINLAVLKKIKPNFEQEARDKGLNERDMLLEANIGIALEDVNLARNYAPECIYMQEGNPVGALGRVAHKQGFGPGRVVSTGTLVEFYRFTKLFAMEFPETTLNRVTGYYAGDHGEGAVHVSDSIRIGGVSIGDYLDNVDPANGRSRVKKVLEQVNREAFTLRDATGQTPSEGPAGACSDMIEYMLNPRGTIVGAAVYVAEEPHYKIRDVFISLPVILDANGARIIRATNFSEEEKRLFVESASHLAEVDKVADELLVKLQGR